MCIAETYVKYTERMTKVSPKPNIITNYKYSVSIQKLRELAFDIIKQTPIRNHTLQSSLRQSKKFSIFFYQHSRTTVSYMSRIKSKLYKEKII